MSILLFKLTAGPLVTLVTRRFGPSAGGWLVGFPLTSGPISVFLALEQGTDYAATAAITSLVGAGTASLFCLVYALCAARLSRLTTLGAALTGYLASVGVLSHIPFTIGTGLAALVVIQGLCLCLAGPDDPHAPPAMVAQWWDIPLRMAATVAVTLAITGLAHFMGPQGVGLLAPFPAFVCILAVFLHAQGNYNALHRFLRGAITSTWGALGYFLVAALCLKQLSLVATYVLSVVVALGLNACIVLLQKRHTLARKC